MKKKFVKAMFFGALALSTITYVGCKDYDDDVKNLQEQIDNINQKGADVTTEAMNAAINSAIAKVQADLDKIAGKADKSALDALQAVVTKLQDAVNGKADSSTLESLKTELNDAINKVNSSIAPQIDAAKKQLQQNIDALESKLETADEDIRNSIVRQIADLKTELQSIMDTNAEEYAKLYATKEELKTLSERVETLEKIKHLTTADVLSFIKTDADVKEYIDNEFVDLLTQNLADPGSALLVYLNGTFTAGIMTEVETKCTEIVTSEMNSLREEWKTYKEGQDENYNAIVRRLETLEGYKLSSMEDLYTQLTDQANNTIAKANACANALGDITNLAEELRKYVTTDKLNDYVTGTGVDEKISAYVDGKITSLDGKISTLEATLKTLQEGLVSMLKSLVFAPQNYGANGELIRSVSFASIYTSTAVTPDGPVVISAPTAVKVNFRVSPASAVADLIGEHPKYTISTNKHVITSRSATDDGILTVASVEQAKDENGESIEGMITVTLNAATALKSYALSLSVQGNNEAEKPVTNFTEINSDYFAVIVSKSYINSVDYVAKTYGTPELLVDKADSEIKFYDATENSNYIKVKLSEDESGSTPIQEFTLGSLGLSDGLFKVTFEKGGTNPDYFVLENGVLTVNQEKTPASDRYNKTCTVTPKIEVTTTGTTAEGQALKVNYTGTPVTAKIVAEGVNLEYAIADQYWNNLAQIVHLKQADLDAILAKIKEVSGNTYADLATAIAAATNNTSTPDGGVTVTPDNGDLKVTIPAKTVGDKTFAPSLKLQYANSAIVNITVKVNVLAPDVTDLKLGANTINWDGTSVVALMPSADADAMSALTVSRKLSEVLLKTDMDAIQAAVTSHEVQLKVVDGEGTDVSGSVTYPDFTVTQSTASNAEVSYTFSLYYTNSTGDKIDLKNLVTVKLKPSVKVAGTVTAPADDKRAIEQSKLTDTYDLSTDFTWKDFRGVTLWPTFAANADDPSITMSTATSAFALDVYDGKVQYIVDKDSRDIFANCFDVTGYDPITGEIAAANKVVKLNTTLQNQQGAIANAITVKILVKASTKWGAPENAATELTITYPAGTEK